MEQEIPICARCGHKATLHVVDDEERRECMEWGCTCEQFEIDLIAQLMTTIFAEWLDGQFVRGLKSPNFESATLDGKNSHPGMKRR